MLDTMYQYEIRYSGVYRGADIQTRLVKSTSEANKKSRDYYYNSLYEYIDSYWYVNTLDTNCCMVLIGIIKLCTIVIQCFIARIMPNGISNAYNELNICNNWCFIGISGAYRGKIAVFSSGNRGLAISLVHYETLNKTINTKNRLIITYR